MLANCFAHICKILNPYMLAFYVPITLKPSPLFIRGLTNSPIYLPGITKTSRPDKNNNVMNTKICLIMRYIFFFMWFT